MTETNEVGDFIAAVPSARRRADAETLLGLYSRVTGEPARLSGTIIGFGSHHYRYESGREGDVAAAGFSPRKAATSIYLMDGISRYPDQLARLGPHTTGVGCLYIRDLSAIDLGVLEQIIAESYTTLTSDTYTLRARAGEPG
ncbi:MULTISPECIES: DUF1801 domain-containing protein [unclassified Leifsonia]|uniref:DUF1801 domain-containing protein n=1 Tax=unclassified Leifsonia TaxID=2663824 RepID=UPI0006FB65AF|nr:MULTISPECIES: DUF1801 domain-containing protein [unclassified Leifsonia]KQX05358.1 hypothetical protein ASC59_14510 [Leifsonia sp. Root1293]KRA08990.1 hypothetical protein ASD61_14505 [Leifsonia sp. Root60]